MFRPHEDDATNRIWVPLHRMSWDWAAYAQDNGNEWDANDHVQANDVSPTNPSFDNPGDLPQWNNNKNELKNNWQPTNPPL